MEREVVVAIADGQLDFDKDYWGIRDFYDTTPSYTKICHKKVEMIKSDRLF